ncbi:MAG: hypothetical protein H0Z34_15525 [Brevibacillus sp.]|nr:hypothetical protein [Brevibacillus sp.]
MKIETFQNGTTIAHDEALQYLLGPTKIKEPDGYYMLDIQLEDADVTVTVDYERTVAEGDLKPIGRHCVFNTTYPNGIFRFEQLIEDLHAQDLEVVENWLYDFLVKNHEVEVAGN